MARVGLDGQDVSGVFILAVMALLKIDRDLALPRSGRRKRKS